MTTTSLIEIAKGGLEENLKDFDPDEDMLPILMHSGEDGQAEIVGLVGGLESPSTKNSLAATIAATLVVARATQAVFGAMSWVVDTKSTSKEDFPTGSLADHPDRREVVTMIHVTSDGDSLYSSDVFRTPGEHPRIGEWSRIDITGQGGGRFVDALRVGIGLAKTTPDNVREAIDGVDRSKAVELLAQAMIRAGTLD